jgi:glucokinase
MVERKKRGMKSYAIGIDLGGTTIKAGSVDAGGNIIKTVTLDSLAMSGPGAVIGQLLKAISELRAQHAGETCSGAGIGAPGVVTGGSVVKNPPNFADWEHVDLGAAVQREISLKVEVENDANMAAVGESRFGAGREHPNFLFVIWGTGVGGGIIIDRKIFYGSHGGAGEIGHLSIDMNGPRCNCGSLGCVESYIGQRYLSERTRNALAAASADSGTSGIIALVEGDLQKIDPKIIARAAESGDRLAKEIFTEAGTFLGYALASILNILDLRIVVIGGGVSAAPQFVYDAVAAATRERVLKPHKEGIRILRAELANQAGIIGAASLVM